MTVPALGGVLGMKVWEFRAEVLHFGPVQHGAPSCRSATEILVDFKGVEETQESHRNKGPGFVVEVA